MSEHVLMVCLGVGLSAACGFRVFVPLLVASLAAHSGHLHLTSGFQWLGSTPALVVLSVATVGEILAYYIPWVDHALDTVSTPASIVAGTLLTASVLTDMSPVMRWALAAIAGGGAAGMVQGATLLTRGASTATTGGFGNPLVATIEWMGALFTSVTALFAPVLIVLLLLLFAAITGITLFRHWRSSRAELALNSLHSGPGEGRTDGVSRAF